MELLVHFVNQCLVYVFVVTPVSGVTLSPRLCSLCCLTLQPTGALLAGGHSSDSAGGNGCQAANDCVL